MELELELDVLEVLVVLLEQLAAASAATATRAIPSRRLRFCLLTSSSLWYTHTVCALPEYGIPAADAEEPRFLAGGRMVDFSQAGVWRLVTAMASTAPDRTSDPGG